MKSDINWEKIAYLIFIGAIFIALAAGMVISKICGMPHSVIQTSAMPVLLVMFIFTFYELKDGC